MHNKLKKVLFTVFSSLFVFSCVAAAGCSSCDDDDGSDGYNGLFAGDSHEYTLTGDYALTEEDVNHTDGTDNVTLGYVCSFNLGGYTLDLNGYTLNISSSSTEVVRFKSGKIKNGKLNISVPNGDIEFTGTDIDETVTYELEAASETIRFSNAVISGKCTVKSNTNVSVEYSNVGDITLSGNGILTAGAGSELGAVKIGENASGATVSVAPTASVANMELHAAANVMVEGSVQGLTVAETAKNSTAELSINIGETASVDKVELNAAANVSVAGSVSSVTVAESAKNSTAELSISIAETASVDKVELNAAASVSVAGSVQSVKVAESAKNDSAALSINVASTAEVARVELNAPASVEVGGGVSNIVVANTAGGSSVKLTDTASVATVAVNAGNTKIESHSNASVSKVVVAESVKETVISNVEVTTVNATEMEEYLAHQHIFVISSRIPATCTVAGKVIKTCECGETQEQTVPALGHNYVFTLIKEPTANSAGTGLYRCIRCGDQYTVDVENNASFVISGLEYMFSFIPDGTYTMSIDKANPVTVAATDEFTAIVKEGDFVLTADHGALSGTASGKFVMEMDDDAEKMEVTFKAVIDGTQIFADYTINNEDDYHNAVESGFVQYPLSAIVKAGLAQFMPFDVDELGNLLPYLENLKDAGEGYAFDIIGKIVDGMTVKTTESGNTVYTFDSDKFLKSLNSVGDKTLDKMVDVVLGEGAYADIVAFTDGIADKTVQSATLKFFSLTEKYGLPRDTIIEIAQKVLDIVAPDTDINVNELVTGYMNKTVKAAVADLMGEGTTEADAKKMIEDNVKEYLDFCTQTTVADAVDMLLAEVGSDGDYDAPSNTPSYPGDYGKPGDNSVDYDKPATLAEEEEDGLTFKSLVDMISEYSGSVTMVVTVNSDNRVVAFEVAYTDESGIKVSVKKTADSLIPVVDVDVMGVQAKVDKTDTGAQAVVDVMGMTFVINADETQTGATLNVTASEDENKFAELDVVITTKKDAQNNVIGAQFALSGEGEIDSTEVTVSGKFSVEKNDSAKVDESVWNSFKGDKAAFYHMNVTVAKNDYVVSLKYVSDDSGEYYILTKTKYYVMSLRIVEEVYTARLLSINGLPEMMIISEDDCTNWAEVMFSYSGIAECTATEYAGGTLKKVNGVYTVVNGVKGETENYGKRSADISTWFYYNLKTGKVSDSSMHNYVYEGAFAEGSKQCSDGIIVTKTCTVCKHTEKITQRYHYTVEKQIAFATQCNEESCIFENECIVCHEKNVYVDRYSHRMTGVHMQIVPDAEYVDEMEGRYIKVSDVTKLGFDTVGFYYGELELQHCVICGLNVYNYMYYTNTTADGCLRHNAYHVDYKGNSGFEAFEHKTEVSSVGHYTVSSSETYSSVTTAIDEVKAIIGQDLLFTPKMAVCREYKCKACGLLTSKTIEMLASESDYYYDSDRIVLNITYVDDAVSSWNCEARSYDLQIVKAQAAKYKASLDGAISGRVELNLYSSTDSSDNLYVYLSDGNGSSMSINMNLSRNTGSMNRNTYYRSQCREESAYYNYVNGDWKLDHSYSNERHEYVSDYVFGDNCREDGFYYFYGCRVCGKSDGKYDVQYNHYDYFAGEYDMDIHYFADYLTNDSLSELQASLSFSRVCEACRTLIDVTIVLHSDWTLENDVYLKAEGIIIDLNGFTIDLNGHNLVIYSYAGEMLVLTDNTFDTSSVEGYDPDTFTDYPSMIMNSGDSGVLVVVSCEDGDMEEEVILGTIAIDCNVFASDADDRYSLFDSFVAEKGYPLDILRAERPERPQM